MMPNHINYFLKALLLFSLLAVFPSNTEVAFAQDENLTSPGPAQSNAGPTANTPRRDRPARPKAAEVRTRRPPHSPPPAAGRPSLRESNKGNPPSAAGRRGPRRGSGGERGVGRGPGDGKRGGTSGPYR